MSGTRLASLYFKFESNYKSISSKNKFNYKSDQIWQIIKVKTLDFCVFMEIRILLHRTIWIIYYIVLSV